MTSKEALVSVITVTYNSSAYVRDTIESVLAQSHTNIEYIIGDDCSTDETWSIIKEYSDERIKAYRNETNIREYPNRNKAIDMATGKYLIFIDGDDIIFPHGIAYFVSQLEAFPDAALAIQKNYYNNLLFPALFHPKETIANVFFGKNLLSSSFTSNFFRREILLKEGKLSTCYITGDEELRFRLACKYPVLYVLGWVSWPRETPNQASSNFRNGIEVMEFCNFSESILAANTELFNDALFQKNIAAKLLQRKTRLIKHLFKNLEWSVAISYMKTLHVSWIDLFSNSRTKNTGIDPLAYYTPAKPFKKGFLNRGV